MGKMILLLMRSVNKNWLSAPVTSTHSSVVTRHFHDLLRIYIYHVNRPLKTVLSGLSVS